MARMLSEEGENPKQIAREIQRQQQKAKDWKDDTEGSKEEQIWEALRGGVSRASFERYADKNQLSPGLRKTYNISKKNDSNNELKLDVIADRLGVDVQDLVDFMLAYPSREAFEKALGFNESENVWKMKQRFEEITGLYPSKQTLDVFAKEQSENSEKTEGNLHQDIQEERANELENLIPNKQQRLPHLIHSENITQGQWRDWLIEFAEEKRYKEIIDKIKENRRLTEQNLLTRIDKYLEHLPAEEIEEALQREQKIAEKEGWVGVLPKVIDSFNSETETTQTHFQNWYAENKQHFESEAEAKTEYDSLSQEERDNYLPFQKGSEKPNKGKSWSKKKFDAFAQAWTKAMGVAGKVVTDAKALTKVLGQDPKSVFFHQQWKEINDRFNAEIDNFKKLPKGHVFQLGNPTQILQSAGIPNLPIELSAKTLEKKSSSEYKKKHPFDLNSIKDLPRALQNPIAVFNNPNNDGKVILTELKHNGVNHIVVLKVRTERGKNEIEIETNSVVTVFPKDKIEEVADWILDKGNQGRKIYFEKEKSSKWLSDNETTLRSKGYPIEDLANIIKNHQNPKVDKTELQAETAENLFGIDLSKIEDKDKREKVKKSWDKLINRINEAKAEAKRLQKEGKSDKEIFEKTRVFKDENGNYHYLLDGTSRTKERTMGKMESRDYADLHPQVTEADYFNATRATFDKLSNEEYDAIESEVPEYTSSFGSKYKIKDGYLYRKADHWGNFATVSWGLTGNAARRWKPNPVQSGRVKISEMSRLPGKLFMESVPLQFLRTPNGTIWGATYINAETGQREYYINPEHLNPETLIHETYHPFDSMMEQAAKD